MGAARTINYKMVPEWGKLAREMTGSRGVDLVVEVGGVGTLNESLRATRIGGSVALIGVLAGGPPKVCACLSLSCSSSASKE